MQLIKKIKSNISRFEKQYFYDELVGTYLIDGVDQLVLIDLPIYSKEIEDHLLSFKKPLSAILSHGPCGIDDGKTWQQRIDLKIYLHRADKDNEWLKIKPDVLFDQPPKLIDGLEIIHTPGHTPGSVCILHKPTMTLFTGDTFSGNPDGSIRNFMKDPDANGDLQLRFDSCKKLLKFEFDSLLPFHYEMIIKDARVALSKFVTEKYQ